MRVLGKQEIWAKRLADGGVALALFNRSEQPARMTVVPADTGFARFSTLRDLRRDAEVPASAATFDVPAPGTVLLSAEGALP